MSTFAWTLIGIMVSSVGVVAMAYYLNGRPEDGKK